VIGDKCIVMEGSLIEKNVILEPGTVVPAYARIPSGQRWGGNPATFIAPLDEGDVDHIKQTAEATTALAWEHLTEYLPYGNSYLQLEELEKKGVTAVQG
jgi:carbonic anhydrase/acetyltransferase-like protein (isoleucine patch superfamily)